MIRYTAYHRKERSWLITLLIIAMIFSSFLAVRAHAEEASTLTEAGQAASEGTGQLTVPVDESPAAGMLQTEQEASALADSSYTATHLSMAPGRNESELNFAWYSPVNPAGSVVQIAERSAMTGSQFPSSRAMTFNGQASRAASGYASNKVTVIGLKPSTSYVYRLGDGLEGHWSPVYTVETRRSDSFRFLFIGDPQIGSGNLAADAAGWTDTLNKAAGMFPDYSFIMSAGDQVNIATSESQYEQYFSPGVLRRLPVATTAGNHDNAVNYTYHFNQPNESKAYGVTAAGGNYYYTYGDALFMVLNTNNNNGASHKAFLQQAAAAHPNAKWKFVTLHHSIYSAASHSTESYIVNLRKALVPVFDELGIDVVFMGHDHSYVRTYQMKGDIPLKNQQTDSSGRVVNPEGTLYLTANSASGSKYYSMKPTAEPYSSVRSQLRVPTFATVNVTPTTFSITTYRTDTMQAVDTYSIVKDSSRTVRNTVLVDGASVWKYLDNGTDQGTAWRAVDFDDSSWKSGAAPLGYPASKTTSSLGPVKTTISYGPSSSRKYITSYFRKAIMVDQADQIISLTGKFGVDDGFVLYANGSEVYRWNMPSGEISYQTLSANTIDEPQTVTADLTDALKGKLINGVNVLAVEVHQRSANSSDQYWSMELNASVVALATQAAA
ncbi:hypothetical protein DNH61_04165 [Paenibacillus sambharensis]|uniref:Metallophosphoesterase n=1 Tax=Paenibacillus sambharensis TaxID=1803190 RepID=A0A2W1LE63_9BACL|nr:metallophosphoesterase family protein [Paenibacillus sambharensis]PZD97093.1 hypothetical protein DNH61_04165 [Paenibacillus sambharensis]